MNPFAPTGDDTANIDVAATTGRVKLGDIVGPLQVRIFNAGTATAWIKFGDVTVTADTTNDIPVGSGVTEVLSVNPPVTGGALYVAAIAAGATGKIYFTPGVGI